MKWTIRKKNNRWIVKFEGESPMEFSSRGGALAYVLVMQLRQLRSLT